MDFSAKFDDVQRRATDAAATVRAATDESRADLKQRIDQAQVDANLAWKDTKDQAQEAAGRAQSKWAQMKADAAARREDFKARVDKRSAQLDASFAATDADFAEADAADAIDFASWAVDNARLLALDALDARAYSNQLTKTAGA